MMIRSVNNYPSPEQTNGVERIVAGGARNGSVLGGVPEDKGRTCVPGGRPKPWKPLEHLSFQQTRTECPFCAEH